MSKWAFSFSLWFTRFFSPPLPSLFSWHFVIAFCADLCGRLALTPSFHLGGDFLLHLPQWGPFSFALLRAILSHFGPGGDPERHKSIFIFDVFLGMRLFAGIGDHIVPRLHFGPEACIFLLGLVITSSPDCILGQRPAFDIWLGLDRAHCSHLTVFGIGAPLRLYAFDGVLIGRCSHLAVACCAAPHLTVFAFDGV